MAKRKKKTIEAIKVIDEVKINDVKDITETPINIEESDGKIPEDITETPETSKIEELKDLTTPADIEPQELKDLTAPADIEPQELIEEVKEEVKEVKKPKKTKKAKDVKPEPKISEDKTESASKKTETTIEKSIDKKVSMEDLLRKAARDLVSDEADKIKEYAKLDLVQAAEKAKTYSLADLGF